MKRIEITVELNDGSTHDLVIANPSLVAWDRTRANFKWPTTEDAPLLWMTFIAHHHMRAHGLVKCDYKEFEEKVCVSVSDTVKPLTKVEKGRLAQLLEQDSLTDDEKVERDQLQERLDESEPDVDPTPPAPEQGSSSS